MARKSHEYRCKPQAMPYDFKSIVFLEKGDLAYVGRSNLLAIRKAWEEELSRFGNCKRVYMHMYRTYGEDIRSSVHEYSRKRCRLARAGIRLIDDLLASSGDKPLFCSAREPGYFVAGDKVYVWIDPSVNRSKVFRNIKKADYYVGEFLGHIVENEDYVCVTLPMIDGPCKNYCLPFKDAYILSEADMHYLSFDAEYCEYFIALCGFDYPEEESMLCSIAEKRSEFAGPPDGMDLDKLEPRPLTLIC